MGWGGGRGGLAVVSQSTISSIHHGNYLASPSVLCPPAALSQLIMIRRRRPEIYTFRRLSIILDIAVNQCCDQRGADDRLGWCWSGAAVWCLLMKMLCDEQLGCGARGQPPTLASLHRSPGPWCRMSPLACTGHTTTQSSVVCTADHNTRLLVSGYLQNWAILSRCIQETCCSVMPLTRTMPPP